MATRRRRNRRILIAVVGVLLLAGLVAVFVLRKPRPEVQGAGCPDVQLVSVPGTWESSPQLDPVNPVQFPNALLLNVTRPLTEQLDGDRLQAYTVPYIAQFHRPLASDNEVDYDVSRRQGTDVTRRAIADIASRCPLTSYVIVGFSQGAVIAGDIASDIGNGRGPVDPDRVLGVTLIADGRRQQGVGQDIGPNPPGQGAEVTLQNVPFIPSGITMTGPREGGFGALNDRTNQICAQGDLICASPDEAFNFLSLPNTLQVLLGAAGEPVHAMYNTTQFWNFGGQPATEWTRDWAADVIKNAPQP
ncbi:MAG TPA: cutinase family protein [Mycobacterium sp.]